MLWLFKSFVVGSLLQYYYLFEFEIWFARILKCVKSLVNNEYKNIINHVVFKF